MMIELLLLLLLVGVVVVGGGDITFIRFLGKKSCDTAACYNCVKQMGKDINGFCLLIHISVLFIVKIENIFL